MAPVAMKAIAQQRAQSVPRLFVILLVIECVGWFPNALPQANGQYPVIEMTAIEPSAIQLGSTVAFQVTAGAQLEQIEQLMFSDPGITAEVVREPVAADAPAGTLGTPKSGHFMVSASADVAPGRYDVRAVGAYGVSNPRVLVVTKHPVIKPATVSHQADAATAIDEHLAASGTAVLIHQATAAQKDFFRVRGQAKHPLRLTLDAQRIDSRMIAQMQLTTVDGRMLENVRGADGFDPSVIIPADPASEYVIAINDFLFRGGSNYFYQLRAEPIDPEVPAVAAVAGEIMQTASTRLPAVDRGEVAAIHRSLLSTTLDSASFLNIDVGAAPVKLSPPCQVAALFPAHRVARPRDGKHGNHHVFEFEAEQGKHWIIEVLSQRLGQPTDPRLSVTRRELKADGTEVWHAVAAEDDPPVIGDAALRIRSRDPVVNFVAPAAATYRINVFNIDSGSSLGQQPPYRLVMREPSADYSLVAALAYPHNDPAQSRPFGVRLMRDDVLPIRVLANRLDGFSGAIKLSVAGLPPGVTAEQAMIAANQTEATLLVKASADALAWAGQIQVTGEAATEGEPIRTVAIPATFQWGSGELRDFIRSRVAHELTIAVTDQQSVPLSVSLLAKPPEPPATPPTSEAPPVSDATADKTPAEPLVLSSKPGTNVTLHVVLSRQEGAKGPITLRPRNLPPGVTAAELVIAADQSNGAIELKIAADAKPGNYSLWFLGETKVKFKPITQADLRDVTVFVPSTSANLELTVSP